MCLGLVYPSRGGHTASLGRNREPFSERRMRENRLSGSMSGMWKREYGRAIETPPHEKEWTTVSRLLEKPAVVEGNKVTNNFSEIIDRVRPPLVVDEKGSISCGGHEALFKISSECVAQRRGKGYES